MGRGSDEALFSELPRASVYLTERVLGFSERGVSVRISSGKAISALKIVLAIQ